MKAHRRTPSRHPNYFTIAPAHPVIPSRAQRLHRRFLRSKSRRIALDAICLGIAIANFALSKNSPYKAISEALNGVANAGNFGDVDASANDHRIFERRFSISDRGWLSHTFMIDNRKSIVADLHGRSFAHRSCGLQ